MIAVPGTAESCGTLVPVMGPLYVGRTTLMNVAELIDDRFRWAQSAETLVDGNRNGAGGSDAAAPYTLLAAEPDDLPALQELPFHMARPVAVVTRAAEWRGRVPSWPEPLEKRAIARRVGQGIDSLQWLLDQDPDDVAWVNNSRRDIGDAAAEFIAVASGEKRPDPGARRVGADLLHLMGVVNPYYRRALRTVAA